MRKHRFFALPIASLGAPVVGAVRDTSISGRNAERKRVTMAEATGTMSTNGRTEPNTGLQSGRLTELRIRLRMAARKADGASRIVALLRPGVVV